MDIGHLILIFGAIVVMVVLAILALIACAVMLAILITAVVSTSVLFGLWRQRVTSGIHALLIQCGTLAGVAAGMVSAVLISKLWPLVSSEARVLAFGAATGALAGLAGALAASALVTKASIHLPKLRKLLPRTTIQPSLT